MQTAYTPPRRKNELLDKRWDKLTREEMEGIIKGVLQRAANSKAVNA